MFLALREIRRAKLRFGLLTGAVGLLVFLVLFLQTLLGALVGFFVGGIENQDAEVLVYAEEARRAVVASSVDPGLADDVTGIDGVADAGVLGVSTFTARVGGEQLDVTLFGHRLGGPGQPTEIVEGRRPEAHGEGVASHVDVDRGLAPGDRIEIEPDGLEIEIVGTARDVRFNVQPTIFTAFETYEDAVLARNPDVPVVRPNLIAVTTATDVDPADLAARIADGLAGVEALDRATAADELPGVEQIERSFAVLVALAFVVIALVIGVFLLILTLQKRDALTLLRAIGADARDLVAVIVWQVLLVVSFGALFGATLTWIAGVASPPSFPITLRPGLALATAGASLAIGLVAAAAAIRRVLRIDPVEATGRSDTGVGL